MSVVTKFPSANQAAGGAFNGSWTNPNSAHTDNSTSATSTSSTEVASAAPGKNGEYASVWNIPFTTGDIPDGSIINSVTVGVEWRVSTTSSVATLRSTAFADSAQTTAVSASPGLNNTAEPTNLTAQTYTATPTLAQLRDLWVRVQMLRGNSNTAVTAYLDYVKVTVDYTATEQHSGSGSLTLTGSLSAAGSKGGKGSGTLTGTASLASAAKKAVRGSGTLSPALVFAAAALKASSGAGTLSLTPTLARSGAKAVNGTGSISLAPSFLADGSASSATPEEHAGTGALALSAAFSVAGSKAATATASLMPALLFAGNGSKATEGSGTLSLNAALSASSTPHGSYDCPNGPGLCTLCAPIVPNRLVGRR